MVHQSINSYIGLKEFKYVKTTILAHFIYIIHEFFFPQYVGEGFKNFTTELLNPQKVKNSTAHPVFITQLSVVFLKYENFKLHHAQLKCCVLLDFRCGTPGSCKSRPSKWNCTSNRWGIRHNKLCFQHSLVWVQRHQQQHCSQNTTNTSFPGQNSAGMASPGRVSFSLYYLKGVMKENPKWFGCVSFRISSLSPECVDPRVFL